MAKHRPHGCPWMFETGADVDVSAPILVVDPSTIGDRRGNAHVQEVLGQIGDGFVARHIYRPRIPRHHRGGVGITRTPEPLRVVGADRSRQPKTGPQFVDRARLAVVEGEDDGIRALRGRQREPHRGNGVDHVRPADLLPKRAGRLACAESACRLDWQHYGQDERRGERGRRQHEPRAHPVGYPPGLDPDSPCG